MKLYYCEARRLQSSSEVKPMGQTWHPSNRLGCGVLTSEVMVLLWASKRCTARCRGVGLTLRRSRFDAASHGVPASVFKGERVEYEALVALSLPTGLTASSGLWQVLTVCPLCAGSEEPQPNLHR